MAVKATYKIYDVNNGWVEYYFKTTADQVGTNGNFAFITFDSNSATLSSTINNKKWTITTESTGNGTISVAKMTLDGTEIDSNVSAYSGTTPMTPADNGLHYLSNGDTVAGALSKLDQAAYDALKAIPDGVLTTNNFATYEPDLAAIEALSATQGFLRKTAANTWQLDTGVVTSVNGQSPNDGAVTIYADQIRMDSSYPANSATVKSTINNLEETIAGKAFSYVISDANPTNVTMPSEVHGWLNSEFATTQIPLTFTVSASGADSLYLGTDANTGNVKYVSVFNLRPGDTIFIKEPNVPDRWLADRYTTDLGTTFVFQILETSSLSWSAIIDPPTTLAGYGVTAPEAATFKASNSNNNTVIKPSQVEVQTGNASARVFTWPDAGGIIATRSWADNKYVPINGLTGGNGTTTGLAKLQMDTYSTPGIAMEEGVGSLYLKASSKAAQYFANKVAISTNANVANPSFIDLLWPTALSGDNNPTNNTIATREWVQSNYRKIYVSSSQPSSAKTGDIWIQTPAS